MIKSNWVNIISFKPSPFRWIYWIFGILFTLNTIGLISIEAATYMIVSNALFALINIIDACLSNTPSWYLKAPNQVKFDLYKVNGQYVSASSIEEVELWAFLENTDKTPEIEKIGTVNRFE